VSLILPDYTRTTPGPTLAIGQEDFLVVAALGLYTIFLVMQVGRHRGYFALRDETSEHVTESSGQEPLLPHAVLLILYMAPVVFLAEQFAHPVDYFIETLKAPVAWGGVIMAILVATPEAIGAVRAATANHLQRSINIFLGSVLSTIGLTIPAMVVVNRFTGHSIILGLGPTDTVMLLLTLAVSVVTFASGRTNVIQGAVHLCLFAAYLMLLFQN
jgi:Ca2+:H+ antiporter